MGKIKKSLKVLDFTFWNLEFVRKYIFETLYYFVQQNVKQFFSCYFFLKNYSVIFKYLWCYMYNLLRLCINLSDQETPIFSIIIYVVKLLKFTKGMGVFLNWLPPPVYCCLSRLAPEFSQWLMFHAEFAFFHKLKFINCLSSK